MVEVPCCVGLADESNRSNGASNDGKLRDVVVVGFDLRCWIRVDPASYYNVFGGLRQDSPVNRKLYWTMRRFRVIEEVDGDFVTLFHSRKRHLEYSKDGQ